MPASIFEVSVSTLSNFTFSPTPLPPSPQVGAYVQQEEQILQQKQMKDLIEDALDNYDPLENRTIDEVYCGPDSLLAPHTVMMLLRFLVT